MGRSNPSRETKSSGANGNNKENINFPRSDDHEQEWQPYPVDLYAAIIIIILHIAYTKQGESHHL